jgi:hypothetical protein
MVLNEPHRTPGSSTGEGQSERPQSVAEVNNNSENPSHRIQEARPTEFVSRLPLQPIENGVVRSRILRNRARARPLALRRIAAQNRAVSDFRSAVPSSAMTAASHALPSVSYLPTPPPSPIPADQPVLESRLPAPFSQTLTAHGEVEEEFMECSQRNSLNSQASERERIRHTSTAASSNSRLIHDEAEHNRAMEVMRNSGWFSATELRRAEGTIDASVMYAQRLIARRQERAFRRATRNREFDLSSPRPGHRRGRGSKN